MMLRVGRGVGTVVDTAHFAQWHDGDTNLGVIVAYAPPPQKCEETRENGRFP